MDCLTHSPAFNYVKMAWVAGLGGAPRHGRARGVLRVRSEGGAPLAVPALGVSEDVVGLARGATCVVSITFCATSGVLNTFG